MSRRSLAARLREACYLEGEFVLRSGATSGHYFDKYRFEADPVLLRDTVVALLPLVPDAIDVVAGPELGGVPLATQLSQATGKPARFVRKQPKAYGTRLLAEGGTVDGLRLLIIEDVVSTGGQIVETVLALRNEGAVCEHALCVILRDEAGVANLAAIGVVLTALFTSADLRRSVEQKPPDSDA
ncbi:MAG: phosphoribosyltransferase family protein [Gammaproteobacteria bacterium]|nr:phosphoribosyltransferase family protein [Gammaproteobacteria bacterium]